MISRAYPARALLVAAFALLGLAALSGCGAEPDARFRSAEAAARTLLGAYAVERMSEAEVTAHLRGGGKFTLKDEAGFRACFADYRGPIDEGLAGFVFGRMAVRKDSLAFKQKGARTEVSLKEAPLASPVAVLVEQDGEWKFSLKDSVPKEIRDRLRELYRQSEATHRRAGGTRLN